MKPQFSLRYQGNQNHSDALNGVVTDAGIVYTLEPGVQITAASREFPEYDAVEWVLWLENKGTENSGIISDLRDCDALLPIRDVPPVPNPGYRPEPGNLCVIAMTGMTKVTNYWENDPISALEYGFEYAYLDKRKDRTRSFANTNGLSSETVVPIFDVTASENGWIAAIGWSGDWQADFVGSSEGIRMRSGMKETNFYLKPGEKLRATSVLLMQYTDSSEKHNKFRRLIRNHFSHRSCTPAQRESLLAFQLWGGLPSEEMKKRLKELQTYGIAFEDIWIDAGWYGQCKDCREAFSGDWFEHTGDWSINRRVHPGQLQDVAQCANEGDMKLMLWIEPERATEIAPIRQERPEWFLTLPGDDSGILWYGNPEAAEYAFETVAAHIRNLNMSCYRQDFNVSLTEYFRQNDAPDRRGILEIYHITGMYRLWDRLLETFPGLIIDNCCGGGRRVDVETVRRSIPFFRSDYQCNFNANPEVLQAHNSGIASYLPYNGCTTKTKSDVYGMRSAYSSSWGGSFYNAVFQTMEEAAFHQARQMVEEYRSIRRYFHEDFYNHGSRTLDETAWAIWQYHDPADQSGIVMAFRRSESPFDQVQIDLRGLTEGEYRFTDLDSKQEIVGGSNIQICLPEKRSSCILRYGRNREDNA